LKKGNAYSNWKTPVLWAKYSKDGDTPSLNIGYDDVLEALKDEDSGDGIYRYGTWPNYSIGINASAIRTGILGFNDNTSYINPFANGSGDNPYYIKLPGLTVSRSGAELSSVTSSGVLAIKSANAYGEIEVSDNEDGSGATMRIDPPVGTITLAPHRWTFRPRGVTDGGLLAGTWHTESEIIIDSDFYLKHDIITIGEQYSILFDNLHPVTYKYNNGTSNRKHTGFIAQEVAEALKKANI
jgi:hypothetical protein